MFSKRNRIVLLLITLIYGIHFLIIEEASIISFLKSPVRGPVFLSLLPIVGLLGFVETRKHAFSKKAWLFMYVPVTLLVTLTAISMKKNFIFNEAYVEFVYSVRSFFTSPMPLALLLYLMRHMKR
jgi:hypothetical protein